MHVISEKDEGMYDTLNKEIELATGDAIGILNYNDYYFSKDTLSRVAGAFADEHVDAVYGDLVYIDRNNTDKVVRAWQSGEYRPRKFYHGWMPLPPTFFVRHRTYQQYGLYNPELGTAASSQSR